MKYKQKYIFTGQDTCTLHFIPEEIFPDTFTFFGYISLLSE